jgi:hypothetical protein
MKDCELLIYCCKIADEKKEGLWCSDPFIASLNQFAA